MDTLSYNFKIGYAGGKKWREKSEWIITENTHQPLIGIDTAECIRRVKAQGLRDAPVEEAANR